MVWVPFPRRITGEIWLQRGATCRLTVDFRRGLHSATYRVSRHVTGRDAGAICRMRPVRFPSSVCPFPNGHFSLSLPVGSFGWESFASSTRTR